MLVKAVANITNERNKISYIVEKSQSNRAT